MCRIPIRLKEKKIDFCIGIFFSHFEPFLNRVFFLLDDIAKLKEMNLLVCQDKNVECDTTVSRLQISAFLEWFSGCHHWAKSPLGTVFPFFCFL